MAKTYSLKQEDTYYTISPDHGFAYQKSLGEDIELVGLVCIPPGKGGVRIETKHGLLPDGKKESVNVVSDIHVHQDHLDDVISELQSLGWKEK